MTFYQYLNGEFQEVETTHQILIADSLLVKDNTVRSLDKHITRLISNAALKAPELLPQIPDFIFDAIALIPKTGSFFPRFEISTNKEFYLNLRPAPEITETVTLWTYPNPDPRTDLTVKGPELDLGSQIRNQAQENYADEAILLNKEGFISEGSLSSLVWWEDDVLVGPGNEIPWLESVTRTEVFEIAQKLNIETITRTAKPEELINHELWLLSSLQGIRTVTNWINLSDDFKTSNKRELFMAELEAFVEQLP
jgi:branched-subunit amino acid aminotransferase/4-amino-4-deoxychorismate lyase